MVPAVETTGIRQRCVDHVHHSQRMRHPLLGGSQIVMRNHRFERDELFVHAVPVNFDINGFLGPVIQSLGEASQHIHRPGDLNRPAVALMSFFWLCPYNWCKF